MLLNAGIHDAFLSGSFFDVWEKIHLFFVMVVAEKRLHFQGVFNEVVSVLDRNVWCGMVNSIESSNYTIMDESHLRRGHCILIIGVLLGLWRWDERNWSMSPPMQWSRHRCRQRMNGVAMSCVQIRDKSNMPDRGLKEY